MTTLSDLINAKSVATVRDELLARLSAAGFPVAAWASVGNVLRTLVQVDATTLSELYGIVAAVARGAYLDLASGEWLTMHAASRFSVTRIPSSFARHVERLTVASGAGPYTVTPGQLVAANASGVRFRSTNTTNVTITSSAPTDLTVQAETAGTDGNASPATVITPALAGVSMAWQSRSETARNAETDPELRTRCRDRWATLGSGFTREAVRYWCTTAEVSAGVSAGVTRVVVPGAPADGSYRVIVAGATGALGSPQVAAVQATLDLHKPITDEPTVESAVEQTISVVGTVRFKSTPTSGEQAAVLAKINEYVNGVELADDLGAQTVDREGIAAACYAAAPGRIADVDLSSPSGDVSVALGFVAVADTGGLVFA